MVQRIFGSAKSMFVTLTGLGSTRMAAVHAVWTGSTAMSPGMGFTTGTGSTGTAPVHAVQAGSTVTGLVDWVGRGGLCGYGTGWDRVGVSWRGANGVGGGSRGGINGDGVDGDIAGGEVDGDGIMLRGVVHDGAEAHGLVDLCRPVGPCGLVRPCVGSGAGCGRWGGVLYLALGRSYPLLLSCIHSLSPYLSFTHFLPLFPSFFLLFQHLNPLHFRLLFGPPMLSNSCVHCSDVGGARIRGGVCCFGLKLGWDWRWHGDDAAHVCYAIGSFRRCCGFVEG